MNNSTKIICEIAQGYEGNPEIANLLLEACIKTNADIIKFQLVYADELSTKSYQHYNLFKKLEMRLSTWTYLVKKAKKNNLKFYFDIFGNKSLNVARKLKVNGVKITTADFYNLELIKKSLKYFDEVILCVSGVEKKELINHLKSIKNNKKLILMYGFQSEPTQVQDNNLNRIRELKKIFPSNKIGFMDHTHGNSKFSFLVPILSLGLGIDILEKHITLDHEIELEDYISALTPKSFKKFVLLFKKLENALGAKKFKITNKELHYKNLASKNLISKKYIKKGNRVKLNDLFFKRLKNNRKILQNPNLIIGKIAKRNIEKNKPLKNSYFK
tara:strand:+ start:901 stop:1887 length:987 start_codon:yes stop_codon:yes gene_type:complete